MKIHKETTLCSTPFLTIKERVVSHGANEYVWQYVSRKLGEKSVCIAAMDLYNRLVVTCEYRPSINCNEWGFPAGLVDNGETSRETAIREMREETGLELINIRLISPFACNSAGLTDEMTAMVFGDVRGQISSEYLDEHEEITTFIMEPEEVAELLTNNYVFSAKAWIVMERFSRTGEIL